MLFSRLCLPRGLAWTRTTAGLAVALAAFAVLTAFTSSAHAPQDDEPSAIPSLTGDTVVDSVLIHQNRRAGAVYNVSASVDGFSVSYRRTSDSPLPVFEWSDPVRTSSPSPAASKTTTPSRSSTGSSEHSSPSPPSAAHVGLAAAEPLTLLLQPLVQARSSVELRDYLSADRDTLAGRPLQRLDLSVLRVDSSSTERTTVLDQRVWVDTDEWLPRRIERDVQVEVGSGDAVPLRIVRTWSEYEEAEARGPPEEPFVWPRRITAEVRPLDGPLSSTDRSGLAARADSIRETLDGTAPGVQSPRTVRRQQTLYAIQSVLADAGESSRPVHVRSVRANDGLPGDVFVKAPSLSYLSDDPEEQPNPPAFRIIQDLVRSHDKDLQDVASFAIETDSFRARHETYVKHGLRTVTVEVESRGSLPPTAASVAGTDWNTVTTAFLYHGTAFQRQETDTLHGHSVERLYLPPSRHPALSYQHAKTYFWIDTDVHRVRRVLQQRRIFLAGSAALKVNVDVQLRDYQNVDGLPIPHRRQVQVRLRPGVTPAEVKELLQSEEDWIRNQPAEKRDQYWESYADHRAFAQRLAEEGDVTFDVSIQRASVEPAPSAE